MIPTINRAYISQNPKFISERTPVNQPFFPTPPMPDVFQPQSIVVGTPMVAPLVNGGQGWFQQVPFQQRSLLTLLLPIGPTLSGTMGLLPMILLEGSQERKYLINQLNTQGIQASISPDGDKMRFTLSCPVGDETKMAWAMNQLMLPPVVDQELFNTLREDGIKSLQRTLNLPELRLFQAVNKALYGTKHPYAKSGKELIDELSSQTTNSVLSVYAQALASPQQLAWLMVSPQSLEHQQVLVNQVIQQGGLFAKVPPGFNALPVTPPAAFGRGTTSVLLPDETVHRASLVQSWRAPVMTDPDYASFLVLIKLLQGPAGKFFQVLRTDRGLVYSTSDEYTLQKQGADYSVSAQVDFDKVGPGLKSMQEVIQSMMSMPVNERDLLKAKKGITLELRSTMQSNEGIAALAIPRLRLDLPLRHPDALRLEIENVTVADVQRVAQRFLNPVNGYQVTGIVAPSNVLTYWFPGQPHTSAFPRESFSSFSANKGTYPGMTLS